MLVSLYAHDVVIFCHPNDLDLPTFHNMLELFGHISGIHTNFSKCSVSPIACSEEVATLAGGLASYPSKYLSILLAIKRLPSEANQALVDRIADKLPT
jgi:hypothetical protein